MNCRSGFTMPASLEILCSACGADTLVRREPVYDGFKKTGEQFLCAACGHSYASEADVPFKRERNVAVFSEADRPDVVKVFREDERGGTCRVCKHYVKNPFVQRCGLHRKEVEATDTCPDFTPWPEQAKSGEIDVVRDP
jgi:hypothetical protein